MIESLVEKVERLQEILIKRATGQISQVTEPEYKSLRGTVLNDPALKDAAPAFLRVCRTTDEFWPIIRDQASSYADRRHFIWESFRPLFDCIESAPASPADLTIAATLKKLDPENVYPLWLKTLERRETEPEGAITLARTLLETVCKHILDARGQSYTAQTDLPDLYKLTAKTLNIAPSQHSEQVFKQILGGCTAIVEGLGAMRNRISDAHGQGRKPVKPAPRHAELAVNLAGAMATFLVQTHIEMP